MLANAPICMDSISPFEFNNIVTGDQFIGREKEVSRLKDLISRHKSVVIYGPPKIGKRSLVFNALSQMDLRGENIVICDIDIFNIRHIDKLLKRLAKHVTNTLFETEEERNRAVSTCLKGISLTMDTRNDLTERQIKTLLNYPQAAAQLKKVHLYIYFQQFQDLLLFDKPMKVLSLLETAFSESKQVSCIIVGDKRNAMDSIFNQMNFFRNLVTEIPLKPVNKKVFAEYICNRFIQNGKKASAKEASTIYEAVGGDPWYVQHLAEICYLMTKEELTPEIVNEGISHLLNIHDYELHNTIYDLSTHQLQLIKAILNGERKFSKTEVLERYHLNSSANVNRLKEALTKKEIVTFVSKNTIEFNDTLLKPWFENYFFNDD